jgi:nucleotide-binding universal stress UspA family protein
MAKILCATRGGEASYKAQDAAIALALESGADLLFIFVVDTEFLVMTERAIRVDTVEREMDHMGEFLLMMALERASKQGVKSSYLIRHGNFRTELIEVAKDPEITTVVLGEPAGEGSLFLKEEIKGFAKEIEEKTQTRVIFANVPDSDN